MDPETKKNALEKVDAIQEFVAYPEKLLNPVAVDEYYKPLRLNFEAGYLKSILCLEKFIVDRNFEKLHMPVDKSDWVTHGKVAVINAFYNLVENSIQFPAGESITFFFILQFSLYIKGKSFQE